MLTAMNLFVHEALLYRDDQSYLAGCLPFITSALDGDAPVMVAVPAANGALIRDALGRHAYRVPIVDMTVDGRNPWRIIPAVLRAFAEDHAGRPVRIIGEPIWAGRSDTEYPACVQHEALVNVAFEGTDAAILCPYDTRRLEPEVVWDAARTHPVIVRGTAREPSRHFARPEEVADDFNRPLPAAPDGAALMIYSTIDDLPEIRRFTLDHAARLGLPYDRAVDVQIGANELTTNSFRYAGGGGELRLWVENGTVVCETRDKGYITDPMAGRLPPAPDAPSGRGLLITNHTCDLTRIHSTPGGTTVRIYFRLPITEEGT